MCRHSHSICSHESCAPYSDCKDQTVGPPWEFDERRLYIVGRKQRTGGRVTVMHLTQREGGELYHPTRAQALEFGRGLALNFNRMNVRLPDRNHYGDCNCDAEETG